MSLEKFFNVLSTKLSKGEFDLPIPVSIWYPLSLILPQKLFSDQLLLSYNQLLSVAALTYWQKPKHLSIPDHLLLPYNNLLSFVTLTDENQSTWYFQLTFTLYMHYMRRFMGFGTIFLYYFKNLRNTHGGVLLSKVEGFNYTKNNTFPWLLFMFFKWCKWYQIPQTIAYSKNT